MSLGASDVYPDPLEFCEKEESLFTLVSYPHVSYWVG